MGLCLSQQPAADALLDRDPLALVIAMVLDQQIPLEKAFSSPLVLTQRLGHDLDAAELASMDPDALGALFATPPALLRFPGSMAQRVQALCRLIVEEYGGDVTTLWFTATNGTELRKRIEALPGFGAQKARIFTALLGKQYGVAVPGWREAAGPFGAADSYLSVADIRDQESLRRVRAYKQQRKAEARAATTGSPAGDLELSPSPGQRKDLKIAGGRATARGAGPYA